MSAHQSTQWFWSDWAGDQQVRRLTPAERGVWIDLLALAAVGSPTGYVCDQRGNPISYEEIARFTNAPPTEVESLIAGILEKGVASRDRTGRLFNRRMVRQAEKSAKKAMAGKLGGDQTRKAWSALKSSALNRNGFNPLPQQMPEHVPRHRDLPLTVPKNLTSTFPVTARATQISAAETAEAPQGLPVKQERKRPDEVSKSELAEIFAKRKAGTG
jgi:hypothetical protein